MISRQFSLSDEANEFIQQQLASGRFTTPDEVVSKTLEEAQVTAAKAKLAELVREGLECEGPDIEFTEEWFDKRMDDIQADFERQSSSKASPA
jgi:Arc/MetJ-type ribon-helix-helix transcriptional regulator